MRRDIPPAPTWRPLTEAERLTRPDPGGRPPPPTATFPRRDDAGGRLRLGLVMPVCYAAGAEEHSRQLVAGLDPSRFTWRGLAVLDGPGAGDPGMFARFSDLLPVAYGRPAAAELAAAVDVLVGWDLGDFPASLAARPGRPAVVAVGHSPPESSWGLKAMTPLDGVDVVVAVSELAVDTIPEARRDGVRVIWNAIDPARLVAGRSRAEMRRAWGVPEAAKVVGFYGRFSEEKGIDVLPGLAASLPAGWHVVAVGRGHLRTSLAGPANLHLPGGDDAAGDVLGAFDRLVSPSHFESFGLSMGEAMHLGLPVVATPAGIVRLHRGLAREVPIRSTGRAWADAVLADVADPEGTSARVARARAFADVHLGLGRMAREWGDLIGSLAAPRPAVEPAARDRVNSCPHRGNELPISAYILAGCCGGGPTRFECRAGRGKVPGQPTLRDCLQCVSA